MGHEVTEKKQADVSVGRQKDEHATLAFPSRSQFMQPLQKTKQYLHLTTVHTAHNPTVIAPNNSAHRWQSHSNCT